ncbi:hypothetical protein JX265_006058 [Neoarthrinium moseri]|uniref:Cytochrome P450 n=1 Tax=Neoarthrinium moseri TaxID=1658444 RepID=A0A9Q0AR70_9PEZI|nr:hypothetical protein JX265_006058 [Neoarthrinium moseri]
MGFIHDGTLISLILGHLLCIVLGWVAWQRFVALSDIPGPFWASVTRLWHAKQIRDGRQTDAILKLHDELGPFVRIAPDEVSVTHPEGVRKLLIDPLRKGYWYETLTFPDSTYRPAISIVDVKEKNERSRLLASAYATSSILHSEHALDRQIELLLKWMENYAASSKPMQLSEFFTFTAYDIMGEVMFSKPFGFLEQGSDIEDSLRQGLEFGSYAAILPYFPWLQRILVSPRIASLELLPFNFIVRRSINALNERKSNPDARYDYVAHWLKTHQKHPDRLTAKDVQAAVTTNVSAGADTVSCALQSFVYHAIRHPTAWQRVRDEIAEAMKEGHCQGDVISFADAQKLPYLQACIKESLRIFVPASIGLPRVVPEGGITIGERTFAAGTMLSLYLPGIMLSKDIWGKDAESFRPERWMDADSAALEKYFIPFGLGYNSCAGQNLARIELSKILPTLVRDFDVEQVNPNQEWSYKPYVTVVPGGWPVYIKRRGAADSKHT